MLRAAVTLPLLPWREDGRCGAGLVAPDGTVPAQCNPWDKLKRTCCSAAGMCEPLGSPGHCSCPSCFDYRLRKPWRDDGRCGTDLKGGDGVRGAICHPLHEKNVTCCSEEGWW